jgi:polyhydroxyalkanoate synthesis regulator phasin
MTSTLTAERLELLDDLRRQLRDQRGPGSARTRRAIEQIEDELAGGRDRAGRAATGELDQGEVAR